jgi:hypothetical protein
VALLEPSDIVDDCGCSGLDAAVVAIDGGMLTDRGVREALGFLFCGEQFDVFAQ